MIKAEFIKLCRSEFGITMFSNPELFLPMKQIFGISGRTFVNWFYKDGTQTYFDTMVDFYFENKRLKAENSKLSECLVSLSKRVENL